MVLFYLQDTYASEAVPYTVEAYAKIKEVQKSYMLKLEGGGPIATAVVALSRLGAKTAMIDCLGDDWIGKKIIEEFSNEKVISSYIKINKGRTSSTASILVRKNDGARTIVYSPGDSPELSEDDLPAELIAKSKYLHINGRHFTACKKAVELAKQYDTKITFDGGSNRFEDEHSEIIPNTDVCIFTKDYATKYSNTFDIYNAANLILGNGPELVVITDGIDGSHLFTKKIRGYHQKAFSMKNVVDTTGCGDCYHGAFLYGLCKSKNLYDAILFASAAAALNTQKLGGRSALPTVDEVEKFIDVRAKQKKIEI